jgi:Cys-tRNA(Pro)/Cys-tRNA(Cys) deacylase
MGSRGTRAVDAARRAAVPYAVHEYAPNVRSSRRDGGPGYALEAVETLGIDAARVFKTIVILVDGRPVLAVVPADSDVDLKAVADALGGRKATIAPPDEAERATGYVLGGISPLGTRRSLPTVVDASACAFPTIHVSAGRRGLEIELAAVDLLRVVAGSMAPVARRA